MEEEGVQLSSPALDDLPIEEAAEEPVRKRVKRGILGAPVGDTPMLFSFTSKELWPEGKDDDSDDEDYRPEARKSVPSTKPRPKTSQPAKGKQQQQQCESASAIASTSSTSSTEVNGDSSTADHSLSTPSLEEDYPSVPSPASDFSSDPSESSQDSTKGKRKGKRARKSPNGKAKAKAKPKKARAKAAVKTPRAKKATSKSPQSSGQAKRASKTINLQKPSTSNGNNQNGHRTSYSATDFNCLLRQLKFDFEQIIPPEILVKIFSFVLEVEQLHAQTLIKLSQVCDNWRNLIISTPVLWRRLDLTGFSDVKFPLQSFQRLNDTNQLFTCVNELNLSGWSGANAEKIIEIVANSSNFDLEMLCVRNCRNISCKFLDTVIRRCPNIKDLDISAITTSSHQNCQNPFTTPVFRPLLEACGGKLESLKLSENMLPSFPTTMSIIMEFCHNLEVLDVSNVASLGARSTSISIDKLQRSCPNLRILRAANVNFTPTVCSAACPPVPGFPKLEELSIPFHENFIVPSLMQDGNTDWTLELLTKDAAKLTLLDIRGSRYISPRGLLKVPTWTLKHLSISNCTKLEEQHETLGNVFTKWSKTLVDVDLSWNKSDKCVEACITALSEVGREESKLKTIQLRGSAVSHEMLRELLRCCPQISSIDLQSCRSLPRGIKRAFFDEEFTKLRTDFLEGKYE